MWHVQSFSRTYIWGTYTRLLEKYIHVSVPYIFGYIWKILRMTSQSFFSDKSEGHVSVSWIYIHVRPYTFRYVSEKNSGCVTSRVSDSGCDTSRVFAGHISEGHIPDFWINIHATPVYIRIHIWKKNSGCLASRIRHYGIYRVAKIHRMPWVAGHFPQKSH